MRKSSMRDFFVQAEFDKLYHRAKLQTDCVLRCGDTAIRLQSRHTPNNREITVQRHYYARIWCFRILRVNRKLIKWTWAEPLEMNIKIEQMSIFIVHNDCQL